MTTRDYADAYADDSENVRAWQPRTALESLAGQAIGDSLHPAQDAQMPPNDSDVAYLRAEIARLQAIIAELKIEIEIANYDWLDGADA